MANTMADEWTESSGTKPKSKGKTKGKGKGKNKGRDRSKPLPDTVAQYINLRNTRDLIEAHEWLFNREKNGEIDSKAADALNTTLKGSVYLNVKLRLDAAKIYIQAHVKKIVIPPGMLPE